MKTPPPTPAVVFVLALCLVLSIGCASVPMTTIQIPTASGPILVKAPKDSEIDGMEMNLEKKTFSMKSYKARMNPDVMAANNAGNIEMLKGYMEMLKMGATMAAQSYGIPAGGLATPGGFIPAPGQAGPQPAPVVFESSTGELFLVPANVVMTRVQKWNTNSPPQVLPAP